MTSRQTFIHFAIGYLTILAPGLLQRKGRQVLEAARKAADLLDHTPLPASDMEPEAWDFALAVSGHEPAPAQLVGIISELLAPTARVEHDPPIPSPGAVR